MWTDLRAFLIAQLVKNPPAMQETPVQFLGPEDLLAKGQIPAPVFLGFPCGSAGKESAHNAGDLGLIPGLGRSPGEGKATHSSILENSMDCTVHGGHKESDTTEQLSLRFTSTQDSETHCDQGHHGGCVGNRGRQGWPP